MLHLNKGTRSKSLLSLFLFAALLLIAGALTAQTSWTGTSGTNWNTPGNWTAGVPDASDNVTIPDMANDPVILTGTGAVALSVNVQTGAVLTVQAGASLNINGSFITGLLNQGTVDNYGFISIGATSYIANAGMENQGIFNNKANAEIRIDRALTYGLFNSGTGVVTNAAKITIGSISLTGNWGIFNQGTFSNNTGGDIRIDRLNAAGIITQGTFTNNASIIIGATASTGTYGLDNDGTFNNAAGEIRIDRSNTIGMTNAGNFTNTAKITIGAGFTVGIYGLYNTATFLNNAGEINIDRSSTTGLINDATFTNVAKVYIGQVADVGNNGIYNRFNATFNNNAGGEIKIDRASATSLFNEGTFSNTEKIYIGQVANAGGYGIRSHNATFNNNAGAEIRIDRSTSFALFNEGSGIFNNAAKIAIGAASSIGGTGIYCSSNFSNSGTGEINVDGSSNTGIFLSNSNFYNNGIVTVGAISGTGKSIDPGGLGLYHNNACAETSVFLPLNVGFLRISNSGLLRVNTNGANTCTAMNNLGIIEYPQGNPIPNVTNYQLIIMPFTTTCSFGTPALQLVGNNFTAAGTWYSNQALSVPAGTYNQATNTFTWANTPAAGMYTLYFELTDNVNGCTRTVSVVVTVVTPAPANAGPDQTSAATCGLTQVNLAANTPTVGTGAWSIVSGAGGSFGNASSPGSTFNGTAGNSYTLRWTISNAPCAASSDDVVVTFNQNPTTANAGPDQTNAATCGLTQVTLAANTPGVGTGAWSIVSGAGGSFGNASSPGSTFNGTAGNTYTLRWTISNAPCPTSTDDVVITFNQSPTTANAGPDQTSATTCNLTQVTLAANTPGVGSGIWNIISGTGGSLGNANNPASSFNGTTGNSYTLRWTISNEICAASADDVVVTFHQNPTVNCPTDLTVYSDNPAFALTSGTPTGGMYSGAGVSGGMFNPATAGAGMHTITYSYTTAAGCSGFCTFAITVNMQDNTPPTAICQDVTVELDATGNGSTTAASVDNGSSGAAGIANMSLNITDFTCADLGGNMVTLTVTDFNGNSSSCTATVTVNDITAPDVTTNLIALGGTDFEVDYSVSDNCDPGPVVISLMEIPNLNGPAITYKVKNKKKLILDTDLNTVKVEAPNPVAFWAAVWSAGGVPVIDGQVLELEYVPGSEYQFGFHNNGDLKSVIGPMISLRCTATDASNNSATATAEPVFPEYSGGSPDPDSKLQRKSDLAAPGARSDNPSGQLPVTGLHIFPNPFSTSSSIQFEVQQAAWVQLEVFNLQGQRVRILQSAMLAAGVHEQRWDGKSGSGQTLEAGLYLIRLQAGETTLTKKVSLMW